MAGSVHPATEAKTAASKEPFVPWHERKDGTGLIAFDPWLEPYASQLR